MTDDGYLSKDRAYLAHLQRKRRARMVRVDYMPATDVLAAIGAKRATVTAGTVEATNSAVLDAIVREWAALTGIKCSEIETPMTSADAAGIIPAICAPAYDFGSDLPPWAESWLTANRAREASRRVICGARRHRDGEPCKAKSEPGKRRCKWHGGCSTGPRTDAGKAKALANLRQHRRVVGEGVGAQSWGEAQPASRPKKGCNVAPLSTVADRVAQSGASERTQRMADKVAKESPVLARQVAHGDPSSRPTKATAKRRQARTREGKARWRTCGVGDLQVAPPD